MSSSDSADDEVFYALDRENVEEIAETVRKLSKVVGLTFPKSLDDGGIAREGFKIVYHFLEALERAEQDEETG